MDEDEEENKLFSDDNEGITSPDLDEPNFNEMKDKGYIPFDFVISSGFTIYISKQGDECRIPDLP